MLITCDIMFLVVNIIIIMMIIIIYFLTWILMNVSRLLSIMVNLTMLLIILAVLLLLLLLNMVLRLVNQILERGFLLLSRKHYFSLVRCLCVMLCCITFLLTSITTEAANTPSPALYTMNNTWTHGEQVTVNGYTAESIATTQSNGSVRTVYYPSLGETYCDYNFRYAPGFITTNISHDKYYRVNTQCRVDLSTTNNGFFVKGNSAFWTWGGNMVSVGIGEVNTSTIFVRGRDLIYLVNNNPDAFVFEGGLLHCNFNVHTFGSAATNVSNIDVNFALNFTFNFYEVSESDFVNNTTTTIVSDVGNQQALQESNNLAQQGNTLAEQGNSIAQDNADTNKDTNNKITSFFNSFFDNLIGVFVPEEGFFSQWFSDLNDFMAQKLGFLWSPFDFLISFLNGVYSGSGSASLVFPELSWIDGTVIIPQSEFSFDNIGGESFQDLRDMIYFATDVILLGAVISQFYKKIKLVFEGGGD